MVEGQEEKNLKKEEEEAGGDLSKSTVLEDELLASQVIELVH